MGRSKELPPTLRARICELYSIGWGYRKIHEKYPQVSISGIRSTVKRETARDDQKSLPRSGRPKLISPEEEKLILDMTKENENITLRELSEAVPSHPSVRTIQRLLKTLKKQKSSEHEHPITPETAEAPLTG